VGLCILVAEVTCGGRPLFLAVAAPYSSVIDSRRVQVKPPTHLADTTERWRARCLTRCSGRRLSKRHEKLQRLPLPKPSPSASSGRIPNPTKLPLKHSPTPVSTGTPTLPPRTTSHASFVTQTLANGRNTTTLMSSTTIDAGKRVHGLSRGVGFLRWIRTLT
jgi:hypothetical protein